MSEITDLIVEELDKKSEVKDLRKNINACLEKTNEYRCVLDSIMEMEGVTVSAKSAKAQALKMTYDHFKPKESEDD
jgi:hypothetical protein